MVVVMSVVLSMVLWWLVMQEEEWCIRAVCVVGSVNGADNGDV